jgi:C4-dicarboxylate-specific signal transduction histidine kinase
MDLKGKDVAFFGKITASMTHEFKNVLAIIKESAGLMEDITRIAPLSESRHQEKFDSALETIKSQLKRGMELSTVFNRFAHAPDKEAAEINLHQLAEQVAVLCERFARLRHITLETADPARSDTGIQTTGNPVWLQMAVSKAIECALDSLPARSVIRLSAETEGGGKYIRLEMSGEEALDADAVYETAQELSAWDELAAVMVALGGRVERLADGCAFRLFFA